MKKKQRMKHSSSSLFCRDFLLKVNARNSFEIPQLSHISINLTSRYIVAEKKHSLFPMVSLSLLSGQHPKLLRAKKSVAGFKLKKNSILGCKLTLRRVKMTSFLDTLALVVLPQIKRDPLFSERTLSEPGVLQLGFTELLFAEQRFFMENKNGHETDFYKAKRRIDDMNLHFKKNEPNPA